MEAFNTLSGLSETMQMYLKTVYEIQSRKGAARVTDIAAGLNVKKASVTSALRTLAAGGYVNYAPYDVVTVTTSGRSIAEDLHRRYAVLHDFFVNVLGIDPETADADSCNLEHHLSETLYERLIGFIEYYQSCATSKFRWDPTMGGFCTDPDPDSDWGPDSGSGPDSGG